MQLSAGSLSVQLGLGFFQPPPPVPDRASGRVLDFRMARDTWYMSFAKRKKKKKNTLARSKDRWRSVGTMRGEVIFFCIYIWNGHAGRQVEGKFQE